MIAIIETDKKYAIVKTILNYIMSFVGFGLISYTLYMVAVDFKQFATLENFEAFYLPIILTIMFLPFVYCTALFMSYETLFVRLQFFVQDSALLRYVKKKTIIAFGPNLWGLNKWSKHVNTLRFKDKEEVDEAVRKFKTAALA